MRKRRKLAKMSHRNFLQDASPLCRCIRNEIPRYVRWGLCQLLQHDYEDFLHREQLLYPLPHACSIPVSTPSSLITLLIWRLVYRPSHDPAIDTFRVEYLVGPSFIFALIFNYQFSFLEILWAFSIYLEAVAILPQLFMVQRTGEAEAITTHYMAALGVYRGLYILNWIYRWFNEGSWDPIAVIAGLAQTGLYADFFYVYFTK